MSRDYSVLARRRSGVSLASVPIHLQRSCDCGQHTGGGECEEKIKEETRATMRCIPLDQEAVLGTGGAPGNRKCVYCGQEAKERAIFARAY